MSVCRFKVQGLRLPASALSNQSIRWPFRLKPVNQYLIDITAVFQYCLINMKALPPETVYRLLGTRRIPGNDVELQKLFLRISELAEMNGEEWIVQNRERLLSEWEFAVQSGLLFS